MSGNPYSTDAYDEGPDLEATGSDEVSPYDAADDSPSPDESPAHEASPAAQWTPAPQPTPTPQATPAPPTGQPDQPSFIPSPVPGFEAPASHGVGPSYEPQPTYGQQPGYGSQPGYTPTPQPAYDPQVGYGAQPGYGVQPGYGSQPGYDQSYGAPAYGAQGQPLYGPPVQHKSKVAAGLLGIFLGALGVHNFYLGHIGKGIAQLLITLLSLGFLSFISGLWGFIEGIMILVAQPGTSMARDARGVELQ
ncbi:TM2 domain-containing protein [uncultured Tessaracoccus sp.]|uniref:TM2 domain-containing protein n=1 Tax=uncultured Tessaracoccus sp. TaxID=905023 RepID=UPI0025D2D684|nr:TM2 domain-containing protein [uncultured Tessaracoccus sp.]